METAERRVALLRGVNVGGHHKMLMADLRSMMNDIGFVDVETYIQSGNVVFGSGPDDSDDAARLIRTAIEDAFGFHVPVIVRTHGDVARTISTSRQLFAPGEECEAGGEGELAHDTKVHVVFLSATPSPCASGRLESNRFPHDEFVLADDSLHIMYGDGAGQSKLTLKLIEKALGVSATARNIATVSKLAEMAHR
jgi:uncharacterized protein (DUF1697 family)